MPSKRKSPATNKSSVALALGGVVFRQRKARGLTQEQFAELVNLSKNYIGNIERGEYEVSVATLDQIAKALGTTAAQMIQEASL